MADKASYSRSLANRHQTLVSLLRDELAKKQEPDDRLERQQQVAVSKESLISNQDQYHDEAKIQQSTKDIPADPQSQLHDFYEYIRTLSVEGLYRFPRFIAPESRLLSPAASLLTHVRLGESWTMRYYDIQGAFYDFAGRCSYHLCPESEAGRAKHIHSIQPGAAWSIEGFPGVFVFSRLYGPLFPELLDTVMDLREREPIDDFEGVLGSDGGGFSGKEVSLPSDVSKLIQQSFPNFFNVEDDQIAKLYFSTPEQQLGLRRPPTEHGTVAHMSFGCDSVLVVGNAEAVEIADEVPQGHNAVDEDRWRDLVSLGSDNEGEKQNPQADNKLLPEGSTSANEKGQPEKPSPPKANAVAIRLRAGDLLLLDGRAAAASTWYGIAKVFDGTSLDPEQQWPHLQYDTDDSGSKSMRGQLSGKAVELEIRSVLPCDRSKTG